MSNANDNSVDDKELHDYLSGDTQYSRRYREIAVDAVPPALDSLVLGNATAENIATRTAAEKRKSTSQRSKSLGFWIRWSVPTTLAASLVFSIAIMLDNGAHDSSAPAVHSVQKAADSSLPAPKVSTRYEQPVADAARELSVPEKREEETARQVQVTAAPSAKSAAKIIASSVTPTVAPAAEAVDKAKKETISSDIPSAPAPLAAIASPVMRSQSQDTATTAKLEEIVVTGQNVRSTPQDSPMAITTFTSQELDKAGANDASRSKAQLGNAKLEKQQREANPDEWLAHIRELRSNGKKREANREWRDFVKAYPTYQVAGDDAARENK